MKKLCCFLLLCCVSLFGKADLQPLNLLKSPLQISNAKTTTFKDGIYTVNHPELGMASRMVQDVTLDQKTVVPLTFAVEVMAKENVRKSGCLFGVLIDLVHTDGSKTPCVNMGAGYDTFDWRLVRRTYVPKKPVKSLRYTIQYVNSKGVVSFRNPMLFSGSVQPDAKQAKSQTPLQKARMKFKHEVLTVRDRHLDTYLVRAGRPSASIVGDAALAARLNEVLKAKTGAELPVLPTPPMRTPRSWTRISSSSATGTATAASPTCTAVTSPFWTPAIRGRGAARSAVSTTPSATITM